MAEAVNIESVPARIAAIQANIELLSDYLDPVELEREIERLESEMQDPAFWDDQDKAAKVSAEHSSTQKKLQSFRALESEAGDLDDMAEMAETDAEMATELVEQLTSVEARLEELEEARLFSGEYDSGDAVVSVHAGAGGTDSQDWAEILLRMYLRWAERRGFDVELDEVSEGSEAGISSATFLVKGRSYRVEDLVGDAEDARRYVGGAGCVVYLSPRDYHRVHAPVAGVVRTVRSLPGDYYPVNSIGLRHVKDLFVRNRRVAIAIDTPEASGLGRVTVVMVAAMVVGRITVSGIDERDVPLGTHELARPLEVQKGDELGIFHLGSTAVVLFERGAFDRWGAAEGPARMGSPLAFAATPGANGGAA